MQGMEKDETPLALTAFDPVVTGVTSYLNEKALHKAREELLNQQLKQRASARLAAKTEKEGGKVRAQSLADASSFVESKATRKTVQLATAELADLETHFG